MLKRLSLIKLFSIKFKFKEFKEVTPSTMGVLCSLLGNSKLFELTSDSGTKFSNKMVQTSGEINVLNIKLKSNYFYKIVENKVINFLRLMREVAGPYIYFDFISCFFFNKIVLLLIKVKDEPSFLRRVYLARIIIPLQISPFLLNLNLNPLYSNLGGSTTLADPFIKKPIIEDFL